MRMHRSVAMLIALAVGGSCFADPPVPIGSDGVASAYRPGTIINAVIVYLCRRDGHWSASLAGDLLDNETERIEIALPEGKARVLIPSLPERAKHCQTKMKDRAQYGYFPCNSAFYSANVASSATATLLRGALSLGVLTLADASSGNTTFTVSLDQAALDAAMAESKAIDFARENWALFEYRAAFAQAQSTKRLRTFIATFDGLFDPEGLVSRARELLPSVAAQEEARARELSAVQARRQEEERQQALVRRRAEAELAAYQNGLRPADRVMVDRSPFPLYGMIIEIKAPLAYVQWENASPQVEWVRLDELRPPVGRPVMFIRR